MFYKLLSVFAILEIAFGTILSVLCILRMSLRDVLSSSTHQGITDAWKTALQQRHYARCGIAFVVSGSILQILLLYTGEIGILFFVSLLLVAIFVPAIISCILTLDYFKKMKSNPRKLSGIQNNQPCSTDFWCDYREEKMQSSMDDLVKICDELEQCKQNKLCFKNDVECTRKVLEGYIDDDHDKLLNIKAELEIHKNFQSSTMGDLSFLVAVITLLITMLYNAGTISPSIMKDCLIITMILPMVLLAVLVIMQIFHKKTAARSKWKKYIAVVIADMEKDKKEI